jgi:hypothetical protein
VGVRVRDAWRTTLRFIRRVSWRLVEERTSMVRPVVHGVPVGTPRPGRDRADVAMDVLQYGTAILAIVVVTLLAVIR